VTFRLCVFEVCIFGCEGIWNYALNNSNYPDVGYPDRLGPSGSFVENSAKLISLEISGYRIEYSTVKCYGCL
jgi:hypothetical protein